MKERETKILNVKIDGAPLGLNDLSSDDTAISSPHECDQNTESTGGKITFDEAADVTIDGERLGLNELTSNDVVDGLAVGLAV